MPWSPTFIDIEKSFDDFVETAKLGIRVDSLISVPNGQLNADYYFQHANVIAELKCLEADSRNPKVFGKRLASAYSQCGYTGSDFMGYLFRGEAIPQDVQRKYMAMETRSALEAIKKANKQIRSTKRLLMQSEAKGLVLIANDNNLGIDPRGALRLMIQAFRRFEGMDCHTDGIVFFTPNVYYDDGTNVAKTVWIPLYNVGSETLADFVNLLGKKWGDFAERFGDPYLTRTAEPDISSSLLAATPIESFRRR